MALNFIVSQMIVEKFVTVEIRNLDFANLICFFMVPLVSMLIIMFCPLIIFFGRC